VRKPDQREYSNEEVAAAILRDQSETISSSYIWYMRTGQRDNPTFKHLKALAKFLRGAARVLLLPGDHEPGRGRTCPAHRDERRWCAGHRVAGGLSGSRSRPCS
jgi:hypothetical protein